jgi:anaerobic magnesium-protoporphyrin IX monomethyl ester cyclase
VDILLTHGYLLHEDPRELQIMKPYPPLGILYLSAYLKQLGYSVKIFDSTYGSLAEYGTLLRQEKPSVVGIYCTLMTKGVVLKMIRAAKSAGAAIILGGPEPANYAEEYLACGADIVVFGEGEAALADLLPALAKRGLEGLDTIPGIAYLGNKGVIVRTPPRMPVQNLDELPDPDRDAIDMDRYMETWKLHHGKSSLSVVCARGCPYQCTWCSHAVYGHSHRRRSPQRVAAEVHHLISRYQPDRLWYADDVFTIHHPWLSDYAGELKRLGLRVPFECISRADRLNEEVIDLLADLGCFRLWLGSESGSQRILDSMKRGVKVEQVRAMTQALKRRGIQAGMFVMLGFDGENMTDLEETVAHLKRSAPDVFLTTIAYPIKGTEYYERVQDRIIAGSAWESRTDQNLSIQGRHSRRFYAFAGRWMVNSVALHKARESGDSPLRLAKAAANAVIGRVGMFVTRHEIERGAPLHTVGSAPGSPT